MILLNFTHPLTAGQRAQVEALTGQALTRISDIPAQFDHERPFVEQVGEMVERVGLTSAQWQSEPLLVNPPALNFITATLLAELHGRMGYFPPIVRLRPVEGSLPPAYEVAEVINLQGVRDAARNRRR